MTKFTINIQPRAADGVDRSSSEYQTAMRAAYCAIRSMDAPLTPATLHELAARMVGEA
jgi:hypothetical protein